jgi:hypothetical protein
MPSEYAETASAHCASLKAALPSALRRAASATGSVGRAGADGEVGGVVGAAAAEDGDDDDGGSSG